jgi:hypothetical protein
LRSVTFNTVGHVRRERWRGRDYLVAPLAMINPGVLAGSQGPLLYTAQDIARYAVDWEGMPLTVYHPTDPITNRPLSAADPGVLDRQGVGLVRRPYFNGKLRAEGWFDEEKTRAVSPAVHRMLNAGEPIELSTGLYTDNEPAPVNSIHRESGRPYTHFARRHAPDHLAVLPDQVGACSLKDGCGVGVHNAAQPPPDCPADGSRWEAVGGDGGTALAGGWSVVRNCGGPGSGVPGPCPAGGGKAPKAKKLSYKEQIAAREKELADRAARLKAEAAAGGVKSQPTPATTFPGAKAPHEHAHEVVKALAGAGNQVDVVHVRAGLAARGITDRRQQDDAINDARRAGLLSASTYEGRATGGVTPEQREAALADPGSATGRIGWLHLKRTYNASAGGWVPLANGFCPTGKGGGQDNSCSSREGKGGGAASPGIKAAFGQTAGGMREGLVKSTWARLKAGKKILFSDNPKTLEGKLQRAHDAGKIKSEADVAKFIDTLHPKGGPAKTPPPKTASHPTPPQSERIAGLGKVIDKAGPGAQKSPAPKAAPAAPPRAGTTSAPGKKPFKGTDSAAGKFAVAGQTADGKAFVHLHDSKEAADATYAKLKGAGFKNVAFVSKPLGAGLTVRQVAEHFGRHYKPQGAKAVRVLHNRRSYDMTGVCSCGGVCDKCGGWAPVAPAFNSASAVINCPGMPEAGSDSYGRGAPGSLLGEVREKYADLQKQLRERFTEEGSYGMPPVTPQLLDAFPDGTVVYRMGAETYRLGYTETDSGCELDEGDPERVKPATSWEPVGNAEGDQPSDDLPGPKACQILKDGTVHGKPLTDAQRGMFGAACGKWKKAGGNGKADNTFADGWETVNCGGPGSGKPGPCPTGGRTHGGVPMLTGGQSRGQLMREAEKKSAEAHALTSKAHKEGTAAAHAAAAQAHEELAFHPNLGQSARGRHIQLGQKHRALAKSLTSNTIEDWAPLARVS